jgi:4-alpha-glucanotransferase
MKIYFFVRFSTLYGQQLSVMGNIDALGNNTTSKALPLKWYNSSLWYGEIEVDANSIKDPIQYKYILTNESGLTIQEWGNDRLIPVHDLPHHSIQVIDTWNHAGTIENAFFTNPFQEYLLPVNNYHLKKQKLNKKITHLFKVKAPLLKKNEVVCLLGNGNTLGNWDTQQPAILQKEGDWYTLALSISTYELPLEYKYGIYNIEQQQFVAYEPGDNRLLHEEQHEDLTIVHDGFVQMKNDEFKGAGVAIPVFSLRTESNFGVGEFSSIKNLADWCATTGLQLIQLLPVNDTSATHTWKDTYPYAAISAFALHPLYLDVFELAGNKYQKLVEPYEAKKQVLNEAAEVQYEEVMQFKWDIIHQLYDKQHKSCFDSKEYKSFFKENEHWLVPYAAFCYLRDLYGTPDFNQWPEHSVYTESEIEKLSHTKAKHHHKIAIHYFVQYHLHSQLSDAVAYAHEKGIIIKGDIPIGIYRYGVDAWIEPDLYHMDMQAGAPPDDFAVKGQNWGFPTYNWEKMEADGFSWWKKRFHQMSYYFDAFRIDHILGFFRIWSIPMHSVEGILGYFVQALPLEQNEIEAQIGWFSHERFCSPYISDAVLWDMFGPNQSKFQQYLVSNHHQQYQLKEEFNTQRKVEAHFSELESTEENQKIKQGLYDLISNLIFIEENGRYHFRFGIRDTYSFKHLSHDVQAKLEHLYNYYFFQRQDEFWRKAAMNKLPALKAATNMLICGEDLGMVPNCVPDVMQQLGILSLEIQRMPKEVGIEFFHPKDAPYLSVVTPSTHDMSTIRGWWEEDLQKTQRFYNNILNEHGDAPFYCEDWINEKIIDQHFYSPAMWAIFQIQDLLGMDGSIRRVHPEEERINVPAIPNYYWKYRMHLSIEELQKNTSFTHKLTEKIRLSGRRSIK